MRSATPSSPVDGTRKMDANGSIWPVGVRGGRWMRSIARTVYVVVAWLFVAGLLIQVFLAGLGVFDSPTSFATHRDVGYTL